MCIEEQGFSDTAVRVVHSSDIKTKTKRTTVIQEIKEGNIEVVIIVQMLIEGLDHYTSASKEL